jgi:rRNA maturation protein Nop10
MKTFVDDITPHKKKRNKKTPKKANHKHEYELVKKKETAGWFNYEEKCKICGKITNFTLKKRVNKCGRSIHISFI